MSQEFLVETTSRLDGIVRPEYPDNYDDAPILNIVGALSGIASFAPIGGGVALVGNIAGVSNNLTSAYDSKLSFTSMDRKDAGIKLQFDVRAMKRSDDKIDILISTHNTYIPSYADEEKLDYSDPVASLFQDRANFTIQPKNSDLLDINSPSVVPMTNLNTAQYSHTVSWSAGAGFSASDIASPSADFSISNSSSVSLKDFNIKKSSDFLGKISWTSEMKNSYDGASASFYDSDNPLGLVVNGAVTKWLNRPAGAAMKDFDLKYIVGYSSVDTNLKNQQVEFEFTAQQRLMHVEIVGRTGFHFARVGGLGAAVPYVVTVSGTLVVDLEKGTTEIKNTTVRGLNLKQIGDAIKQESKVAVAPKKNTRGKLFTRADLKSRWMQASDKGGIVAALTTMGDGTILAIGIDQKLYTRANLNSSWVKAPDKGGLIIAVAFMKDGTILATGIDKKLYTRADLNSRWIKAPDMGGRVTAITVMQNGMILAVGVDQKLYTRANLNSPWVKAPNMGGLVTDVDIMQDGTILAIGIDEKLYTRANLNSRWVKAPDMGGLVTAVTVMQDGTILAIGA